MSSTLPFCYGEFVLFKGKSMYSINEVTIIDSFQELLRDMDTITYASYFNELVDIAMENEESNRDFFRDFVTTFYLIKNNVGDIEILARAFEVKLLKATGYGINLEHCSRCREKINTSNFIDFLELGAVCADCDKNNCYKINNATYSTLKFLSNISMEKVHRIVVAENSKKELYNILHSFISMNYTRKPKSLEMFEYLTTFQKESPPLP